MSSIVYDIYKRDLPPPKVTSSLFPVRGPLPVQSVTKPDGWDFKNKEMQILKRELQMLCDEEKEMAREKTARQQLVIRNCIYMATQLIHFRLRSVINEKQEYSEHRRR